MRSHRFKPHSAPVLSETADRSDWCFCSLGLSTVATAVGRLISVHRNALTRWPRRGVVQVYAVMCSYTRISDAEHFFRRGHHRGDTNYLPIDLKVNTCSSAKKSDSPSGEKVEIFRYKFCCIFLSVCILEPVHCFQVITTTTRLNYLTGT